VKRSKEYFKRIYKEEKNYIKQHPNVNFVDQAFQETKEVNLNKIIERKLLKDSFIKEITSE